MTALIVELLSSESVVSENLVGVVFEYIELGLRSDGNGQNNLFCSSLMVLQMLLTQRSPIKYSIIEDIGQVLLNSLVATD